MGILTKFMYLGIYQHTYLKLLLKLICFMIIVNRQRLLIFFINNFLFFKYMIYLLCTVQFQELTIIAIFNNFILFYLILSIK